MACSLRPPRWSVHCDATVVRVERSGRRQLDKHARCSVEPVRQGKNDETANGG